MSLRHTLLGFLALTPMTGYDLRKSIAQSVGHFWTADQAQIYRTLASLVQEGLVSAETQQQEERPNRRVHRIQPDGLVELDRWLAAPLQPVPVREPFLLRVFLGGRLGPAQICQILADRVSEAEDMITTLGAIEASLLQAPPTDLETRLRLATLQNGLAHARAERDWALSLQVELEKAEVDG